MYLYKKRYDGDYFEVIMKALPMTVTKLFIRHCSLEKASRKNALVDAIKRLKLTHLSLCNCKIDVVYFFQAIAESSITHLTLQLRNRWFHRGLQNVIKRIYLRGNWSAINITTEAPDGCLMTSADWIQVIRTSPNLVSLEFNDSLPEDENIGDLLILLSRTNLEHLQLREPNSAIREETTLQAVAQIKTLIALGIHSSHLDRPSIGSVLTTLPRLRALHVFGGDELNTSLKTTMLPYLTYPLEEVTFSNEWGDVWEYFGIKQRLDGFHTTKANALAVLCSMHYVPRLYLREKIPLPVHLFRALKVYL